MSEHKLPRPKSSKSFSTGITERFNQGAAFHTHGKLTEAEQIYTEILSRAANHVEALNLLGVLMVQTKRLERGLELMHRALNLQPNFAETHFNCGIALRELKRFEDALASFDKAIALKTEYVEAYCGRGIVLKELGRFEEALASHERALALKPSYAEAHNNRGTALRCLKRVEEALTSFDKAIALQPNFVEADLNRGNVLRELGRLDDALACHDKAITLKPDLAEAHFERGVVLRELSRLDEAIASFDKAIALKPELEDVQLYKGYALLLHGRFKEGWPLYEKRKGKLENTIYFTRLCSNKPLWLGAESITGKTLFVYWEQGLGDTIQFYRYLELVEQLGARVIFSAPNCLRRLFQTLAGSLTFVGQGEVPDDYDIHCPLMSLPLALGTSIETIPADTPYLRAEADRVQKWKHRLGGHGLKIGVAWQGSTGKANVGKSFPLEELFGLSQIENVRLISLQKGDGAEQLNELRPGMKVESPGEDSDAGADAFLDAAAIMENTELVITPDTAIAHLAGALGCPTWLALKHVPDWRWLLGRNDSPWYPTMRLFRQAERGGWRGVFAAMELELRALVSSGRRAPPAVEALRTPAPRAPARGVN
jgi:tetratricopeptide (TPR) repeat protein